DCADSYPSASVIRDDENVARRKPKVSCRPLSNLLNVHIKVYSRVLTCLAAQYSRLLRVRCSQHAARASEGLQDRHGTTRAEGYYSGSGDFPDNIDNISLGDRDDVIGLDDYVLFGSHAVEEWLHSDLDGAETVDAVYRSLRQRNGADVQAPRDAHDRAGIVLQSAGQRDQLDERLTSLELANARAANRPNHGHRLAAELGEEDRDIGLLEVYLQALSKLALECFDGHARRVHLANQRQPEIAVG